MWSSCQVSSLEGLMSRNQEMVVKTQGPAEGFTLPFILLEVLLNLLFSLVSCFSMSLSISISNLPADKSSRSSRNWDFWRYATCPPRLQQVLDTISSISKYLLFSVRSEIENLFAVSSTPFSVHDDAYILKLMQEQKQQQNRVSSSSSTLHQSQLSSAHSSSSSCIASGTSGPVCWNSGSIDTRWPTKPWFYSQILKMKKKKKKTSKVI